MSSPLEHYLVELRDPSKPVVMSKLAELSDLSPEEAEIFRREWPSIDVARRRQIVGRLAELAEDNFDLDFGGKGVVLYATGGPSNTIIDCNNLGRSCNNCDNELS